MQKLELIEKMAARAGLTKEQASNALAAFIVETVSALKAGDKVTLIGFGTLKPSIPTPRIITDSETGELMQIKASRSTKFLPGKSLKYLDDNTIPLKTKVTPQEPEFTIL